MLRLIIIILFFLLSLLVLFPAPVLSVWYVAIIVTEFPWVFALVSLVLLVWGFRAKRFRVANTTLALASSIIYLLPVVQAMQIAARLKTEKSIAVGNPGIIDKTPFSFWRMFAGPVKEEPFKVMQYDTVNKLTLDYYPVLKEGSHPCVVMIHGGSWKGGDSRQLPELNSVLVKKGYNVAAINYRKAPECQSPSQLEDVRHAMEYLRANAAMLNIDTSKFVLLGRSAGGQIALLAAYTFKDMGIKGVISYYGPADMIWGYKNPAVVYNSCKVLEDYIGGTYDEEPNAYLASSPIEAVDSTTVPTLLIHGKNDVLVAYGHSTRLVERLNKYGVPNYLLTLPWATHGCDYTLNGPSGQLATYAVERFLRKINKSEILIFFYDNSANSGQTSPTPHYNPPPPSNTSALSRL